MDESGGSAPRRSRRWALAIGVGVLLAGAAGIGAVSLRPTPAPPPAVTLAFDPLPDDTAPAAPRPPVTIGIYGDSMADGLWLAMSKALRATGGFRILRFSHPSTGLVRYDFRDVGAQTQEQVAAQPVDVAVVMIGTNDRQGMLRDGRLIRFDSDEWRAVYAQRMAEMATTLRRSGAAVFWVGLPKMRNAEFDAGAARIARIQEDTARALSVPFIPMRAATADAAGLYSPYGDGGLAGGQVLRASDGIHMTGAGYTRLAAPVIDQVRGYLVNVRAASHGASAHVALVSAEAR